MRVIIVGTSSAKSTPNSSIACSAVAASKRGEL